MDVDQQKMLNTIHVCNVNNLFDLNAKTKNDSLKRKIKQKKNLII